MRGRCVVGFPTRAPPNKIRMCHLLDRGHRTSCPSPMLTLDIHPGHGGLKPISGVSRTRQLVMVTAGSGSFPNWADDAQLGDAPLLIAESASYASPRDSGPGTRNRHHRHRRRPDGTARSDPRAGSRAAHLRRRNRPPPAPRALGGVRHRRRLPRLHRARRGQHRRRARAPARADALPRPRATTGPGRCPGGALLPAHRLPPAEPRTVRGAAATADGAGRTRQRAHLDHPGRRPADAEPDQGHRARVAAAGHR